MNPASKDHNFARCRHAQLEQAGFPAPACLASGPRRRRASLGQTAKGAGHWMMLERPGEVNDLLLEFLAKP